MLYCIIYIVIEFLYFKL